ncbi:hypothetical protein G6F70_002525 [Rhizopus microsporus]|uniref:Cysteine protease n=2 Tax=Rhizopus TaxID=4842 RepID=A0A367KFY0_RHIAZ|nr:hypothetical protein G6F71_003940 [Rhizopus microsporus]RCI01134.1 Cysteine protease atg4 [Rhizopus azygosporus]KAG1202127.1 hypothetical protein G6F70_002525 [Rhizopus microsporus]KAG1215930.1 hypothetical protein G6F69_000564 [Rhizopus microsporus]KAG1237298.1 hypothetical protein G6F67_001328 [Rhizopus microsporus]
MTNMTSFEQQNKRIHVNRKDTESSDKELPQPQNSNHLSTAPLKDKLITNSSYLAAEIPLKLGHFMSNLWISGSELSSSFFLQQQQQQQDNKDSNTIWLLGRSYIINPADNIQQALLEAQREIMFKSPSAASKQEEEYNSNMYLLWPPDFYDDFTSRLWMTYRHNYPPIRPSNHKTDIGWGCMLRSGQSLLANTLVIHFLGRDWRRQNQSQTTWKQYSRIVHWFLDELSPRAPFSIHRIALLGKQLGKNIGEWFGPSTISQVIQALVSDFTPANLSVYITTDGVIYKDDVHDVATGKKPRGDFSYLSSLADKEGREEAKHLYDASTPQSASIKSTSFKPVLILIALRLGIDSLHPTYYDALKSCFEIPSFVGIAGGRPNSSLYFIGLQGDELIYLDPHYSRPALETKSLSQYTKEDFNTYHCTIPRKIHISSIDPSMLIGFYCRNAKEFDSLCEQITQMSKEYSPIISVEQSAPAYDEDVRSENDFGIMSDEEADSDDCDE